MKKSFFLPPPSISEEDMQRSEIARKKREEEDDRRRKEAIEKELASYDNISIPDTIMMPDPGSCFVFPIKIKPKTSSTGLILENAKVVEYRSRERVRVEAMRRIIIKTGFVMQKNLSIPVLKLFGLTLLSIKPRPGDELIRMEMREAAASSPKITDPNTMHDFELHHHMEIRSIIFNTTIKRPFYEKWAAKRLVALKSCTIGF